MHLDSWLSRLKDECPLLKNRVYGAAELAAANSAAMQTPCAFIIPLAEKAEGVILAGGGKQRIVGQVGVVIAIKNVKDGRGEQSHHDLNAVRTEVFKALCGWQSTGSITPTAFVQGQLAGYDNATLRWNDVFSFTYYHTGS